MWGEVDGPAFTSLIKDAYSEVVNWRRNLFTIPSGASGKKFVNELARLFGTYSNSSALESVALYAAMTMPALLLQKPQRSSKIREHTAYLERRLHLWETGDISSLLQEGRCIQQRLPRQLRQQGPSSDGESSLTRRFMYMMQNGKTKDAVRLLSEQVKGGVLHLNDPADPSDPRGKTMLDVLVSKHPSGQDAHPDTLIPMDDTSAKDTIQYYLRA